MTRKRTQGKAVDGPVAETKLPEKNEDGAHALTFGQRRALGEILPARSDISPEAAKASRSNTYAVQKAQQRLRDMEDEMLAKAQDVLMKTALAADIDDDQEGVPQEWVEEMGEKEARRALRIARDGRKSPSQKPNYLEIQQKLYTGITKARATEGKDTGPKQLIQINVAIGGHSYPTQDLPPEET